uniref:Triple QxxK/R motif-containing protein n=1 Tax=Denticeps clupeoides TaxID=299321 RepID=A0AAY4CK65_9TELE
MGKKDASTARLPVDQYRKQIGKQDYKKTKVALKLNRLKAEAKRSAPGIRLCLLSLRARACCPVSSAAAWHLWPAPQLVLRGWCPVRGPPPPAAGPSVP